jgi:hypothetical protein
VVVGLKGGALAMIDRLPMEAGGAEDIHLDTVKSLVSRLTILCYKYKFLIESAQYRMVLRPLIDEGMRHPP